MGKLFDLSAPPFARDIGHQRNTRPRLIMFLVWMVLVSWLMSGHVFWRDEVRALSLALSGSNLVEMLRNIHGEGHPAIWYLLLRGAHEIAPYREVLPALGALIGAAAMALFAFRSPFKAAIIGLVLFSAYGAYEYVVIARNYGLAALVMFAIAALYNRVSNTLWLGVLLALLCNTNVPSVILAAAFLSFHLIEMIVQRSTIAPRDWQTFFGNAAIAAFGAWLCFITVYPTVHDAAVSRNFGSFTIGRLVEALLDNEKSFWNLGMPHSLLLGIICLSLARWPSALISAFVAFFTLKMFFFFVYLSYFRHEVLFVIFLLSLHWIVAEGNGGNPVHKDWAKKLTLFGQWAFVSLLASQSLLVLKPIYYQIADIPRSRSADVAALLQRPQLSNAIVMGDPDTMLEPFPYYVQNSIWFLRQQRSGRVVQLTTNGREDLRLDDILSDARRLHFASGRPIVILLRLKLQMQPASRRQTLFTLTTSLTPESELRFRQSTRLLASYPRAGTDESYDVYVYPR